MLQSLPLTSHIQKILPQGIAPAEAHLHLAKMVSEQSDDIKNLIESLDKSLFALNHAYKATVNAYAILEELGGITIQAKNFCLSKRGYIDHKDALDRLMGLFKFTIEKIDHIVANASIDGVNLLMGEPLVTHFDARGHMKLVTQGLLLSSANLGFREPNFTSAMDSQNSRIDVMNAMDMTIALRTMIQDDIFTITTRKDFSQLSMDAAAIGRKSLLKAENIIEGHALKTINEELMTASLGEEEQTKIFEQFIHHSARTELAD